METSPPGEPGASSSVQQWDQGMMCLINLFLNRHMRGQLVKAMSEVYSLGKMLDAIWKVERYHKITQGKGCTE